uniref:Putative secreted protein n=1 Tax=Anopheles darlingi TaxID=43151 RepID=A0A2M4DCL0_ANODA
MEHPVAIIAVTTAVAATAVATCTSMNLPSRYLLRYHTFLTYRKTHCLHIDSVHCPAVFLHPAVPACSE